MSRILAAIDDSDAARPVLFMATALGRVLNASIEALHVSDDDVGAPAIGIADTFGVACHTIDGDPFTRIVAAAAQDDVVAVVIGARGRSHGCGLSHLAGQIAGAVEKPLVVVPPGARSTGRLHRVVIAMEGTRANWRDLKSTIDLADSADLELVVVHVDDEDSIPSFSDQVAHETEAYANEFLARYLRGAPQARLELRVGVPSEEILRFAHSLSADVLAVGWPHVADLNRGATAREILNQSHVPVMLVALAQGD